MSKQRLKTKKKRRENIGNRIKLNKKLQLIFLRKQELCLLNKNNQVCKKEKLKTIKNLETKIMAIEILKLMATLEERKIS